MRHVKMVQFVIELSVGQPSDDFIVWEIVIIHLTSHFAVAGK